MLNGFGLLGHYSATQGSIIIPYPGNCNLFFIFTLDGKENGFVNGCRYSIVDISLQNGLGEVTTKNVLLYGPSSEKLTAVKHGNGSDIWVITHKMFTNSFYTYRVSVTGIDTVPVISSIGLPFNSVFDAIGQMKTSPDGRRLAYVTLVNKIAEIFDFDNSTGIVSNPITIPASKFTVIGGLYGLEFSPSSGKLYVTNPIID
jgi:hypothetical protein